MDQFELILHYHIVELVTMKNQTNFSNEIFFAELAKNYQISDDHVILHEILSFLFKIIKTRFDHGVISCKELEASLKKKFFN